MAIMGEITPATTRNTHFDNTSFPCSSIAIFSVGFKMAALMAAKTLLRHTNGYDIKVLH